MTIRVVLRPDNDGGMHYPLVVCDICERPILGDGAAWWLDLDDGGLVWHAHRAEACGGELDERLSLTFGAGLVRDEELDLWLAHVVHNAGAPFDVRDGARKVHRSYCADGPRAICGTRRARRFTSDDRAVTCKRCRAHEMRGSADAET